MADYREGSTGPKDLTFGIFIGLIIGAGLMYLIL